MAITATGMNFIDPNAGVYSYGDGGVGALRVDANSLFAPPAGNNGNLTFISGFGAGGDGTVTATTGGAIRADVTGFAQLLVGWQGATGAVDVSAGGAIELTATGNAFLGLGDGGPSTLDLDGGTVSLASRSQDSGMNVLGGSAVMLANGAQFIATSGSASGSFGAYVNVGRSGASPGTALLDVRGSTLRLEATEPAGGYAILNVGRQGATGTLSLNGADVDLVSQHASVMRLGVAFQSNATSTGTATVQNGTTLDITGETASILVGDDFGGVGTLNILSGSVATLTGTSTTELFGLGIAIEDGTVGTATVSGAGSAVSTNGGFQVGIDAATSLGAASTGSLTLINGAAVTVTLGGLVGVGGTLRLGDAALDLAGGLGVSGGTVRVFANATPSITGDVSVSAGSRFVFEVDGAGNSGTIQHDGAFFTADANAILQIAASGTFAAGDTLRLVSTTGTAASGLEADDVVVTGQGAGFGFALVRSAAGTGEVVDFEVVTTTGADAFSLGAQSTVAGEVTVEANGASGTGGDTLSFVADGVSRFSGTAAGDTFTANVASRVVFDGLGGNDTLRGGGGNDRLDGGFGDDNLVGGSGNDLYVVDSAGDRVSELAGEGTDFVYASVNYALGAHVENLLLTGTADLRAIGNSVGNVVLGNAGSNALYGNGGNDLIRGEAGNDRLDGGFGNDRMIGGAGNDTYVVDSARDQTVEAAGGGTDRVVARVSHTLSAEVENLSLVGTGNTNGQGNALGNVLIGNAGSNGLFGRDGNDLLRGEAGDDFLYGGVGNDRMIGGAGADVLRGDAGADTFVFAPGGGGAGVRDRVADFADGVDRIDIAAFGVANGAGANDWLGATTSVANTGGGVVVTWTDGTEAQFTGIVAAQLSDTDFVF